MSDITVDQKMQLIRQVRSQYNKDQYDLMHREQLLYGRTTPGRMTIQKTPETGMLTEDFPTVGTELPGQFSTLKLRLLAAVVLFLAVLAMDINGTRVFGISTSSIFESISKDVTTESLNMIDEFTNAWSTGTDISPSEK